MTGGDSSSANQAVAKARPQVEASNAFLYVEFQVGSQWILADDLRNMPDFCLPRDEVEDIALDRAREHVRQTAASKRIHLTPEKVDAIAEIELDTREWYWEVARSWKAALDSVDLKSLDLTRL